MSKIYKKVLTFLFVFSFSFTTLSLFAQNKTIPNFSEKPRSEIPSEYTWKIDDLYATYDDWQKDKQAATDMLSKVDAMSKNWTQSPQKFYELLKFAEDFEVKTSRLFSYASNQANMDLSNTEFAQMKASMQQIFVQAGVKFAFINNDVLKMDIKVLWDYFEKEPRLKPFRFDIERIVRNKEHILPEDQEKLLSMTGLFSGTSSQASGLLRDVDLPAPEVTLSDGSKINLNTANFVNYRSSKNADDRSLIMRTFFANHKKFENTFASLLDGAIKQHVFGSRVRKHQSCLQAKLFGDNIDTNVYYTLIKAVGENLSPLHRYLKLKKELLGVDKFRYEDIYASSVKQVDKTYTYDEAKEIVLTAVKPLGNEYVETLRKAFDSRWVDIYPNKGKQSGAYSSGVYGVHPFVKMNYNGKYDAVSTLAHELGHAMHSYLSTSNQTYGNSQYTIFLAEIASTFNENLLMDYMLKNETDDMFKLFILDNYLDQARGTIYRQSLFAEFELAMHKAAESGKVLSPEFLNSTYLELTRKYYGHNEGVTQVDDYIQNEWSFIPHFYMYYYVYQYSTGMISSMALSDRVINKGGEYTDKYLTLLKSGGSDYPLELLKKAGVDMTTKEPYVAGLERFNNYVSEMEKIVERLKQARKL